MAGKAYAGGLTNRWSARGQKAYCDGMFHRMTNFGDEVPISDNPYLTAVDRELELAWDAGWTFADDNAEDALPKCNCNIEGIVPAETDPE